MTVSEIQGAMRSVQRQVGRAIVGESGPPKAIGDLLTGAVAIAAAALARIGIEQLAGGIAPFVLTFPAVMLATLARGSRAGTIAALGCQLLTIRYVFPHWVSRHGGTSAELANVLLSTIAFAGTIWATASYRRAAGLLRLQCERQVDTLSLLITEMDHRTKNNFQIAANLLAHQAISVCDVALSRELEQAASRLETIASVYHELSLDTAHGDQIDLADHLGRIVEILRVGAVPPHVAVRLQADHVVLPMQTGVIVGLIVNEWVTNALKHAFGEREGRIDIEVSDREGDIKIVVWDDGGRYDASNIGRGGELVRSLAEVIAGSVLIGLDGGTRCSLRFCT